MWVQMIPKDIINDIIQLAKSVKTDAKKVVVSNIPKKDKFNSKVKEVNIHVKDICYSAILTHTVKKL